MANENNFRAVVDLFQHKSQKLEQVVYILSAVCSLYTYALIAKGK